MLVLFSSYKPIIQPMTSSGALFDTLFDMSTTDKSILFYLVCLPVRFLIGLTLLLVAGDIYLNIGLLVFSTYHTILYTFSATKKPDDMPWWRNTRIKHLYRFTFYLSLLVLAIVSFSTRSGRICHIIASMLMFADTLKGAFHYSLWYFYT